MIAIDEWVYFQGKALFGIFVVYEKLRINQ